MLDLNDRLKRIKEGYLLEADDDYDLPGDLTKDKSDDTPPADDTTSEPDTTTDDSTATEDDPTTNDDETDDSSYDLNTDDQGDDPTATDGTGDDPSTTDNSNGPMTSDQTDGQAQPATQGPKPGEVIELDSTDRAILQFRNFRKYRELRDDVNQILNDLTSLPSFSDVNRAILDATIERATKLRDKLNDYLLYKYKENSYEVNFKNFADFIIEKRLIQDLITTITDTTKE